LSVDSRTGTLNLDESQQGKATQVNENLALLGALLMGSAKSASLTTPPASPADGDVYIVPIGATGIWATKVGRIAHYQTSKGWLYYIPAAGWTRTVIDRQGAQFFYDGTTWRSPIFGEATLATSGALTLTTGQLLTFDTSVMEGGLAFATSLITVAKANRYTLSGLLSGEVTTTAVDASIELFAKINGANTHYLGTLFIELIGTKPVSILVQKQISLAVGDSIGISLGAINGVSTFNRIAGANWMQLN
jgi:hypothetical protein